MTRESFTSTSAGSSSRRVALVAVSVAALVVGCGTSNSLAPIVRVTPALDSLVFSSFFTVWSESGILAIHGALAPSVPRLQSHERIPVRITVSSGDVEEMLLESLFDFPGPRYRTLLTVSMSAGHTVEELTDVVAGIPARWWLISSSHTSGGLRVFDSRVADGAIRTLLSRDGVASAERDIAGFAGSPSNLEAQLFAAAPLNYGQSISGDGVVQGQSGDQIVIEYTQPNGSIISASILIEAPAPTVSRR